ncbi:MAG: hypothetical protein ACRDRX_25860 [Pseudonocardiaceae bacterium]
MSLLAIPPWSTVVTCHGVLFAPLTAVDDRIYGWAAYIHTPAGRDPDAEFWGSAWTKVLGMRYDEYRLLVSHIPGLADDRLGRLASIDPRAITYALFPQEPELVARHGDRLHALAATLHVPASTLGVYGSAVYKPPEQRSDLDFVIYGEHHARTALAVIRELLAAHRPYRKPDGRRYHLRFRVPGVDEWFDPRFSTPDPITPALVSGAYELLGERPMGTVTVTDDRMGLFNPARYQLSDGTMLVSYRLGHAALFRTGDRLALPSLPCARFGEQVVRLVLRYEHIDIVRSREPHVDPVRYRPHRSGRTQADLPADRRHAHLQ